MKMRILILTLLAFVGLCCNAPNQQPPSQPAVNILQNARQAVIYAQERVADAQATVDALQTAVDALPPNDPLRGEFERQLAEARPVLADANLVLTAARLVADVLAGPPQAPATTQPAAPAVSPPATMPPAL